MGEVENGVGHGGYISYRTSLLGPQFDYYLRAQVLPYLVETASETDRLLVQVDPLDIGPNSAPPSKVIGAGVIHLFE